MEWETEQEIFTEIQNGQSELSKSFVNNELLNSDKQYNFSRYSKGLVLELNISEIIKASKKLRLPFNKNQIINLKGNLLRNEIEKRYAAKKKKQERTGWMQKYDVENGSIE